jgi:hypothetical protein
MSARSRTGCAALARRYGVCPSAFGTVGVLKRRKNLKCKDFRAEGQNRSGCIRIEGILLHPYPRWVGVGRRGAG